MSLGRRRFLGRVGTFAGGLTAAGLATACGRGTPAATGGGARLVFENWPAYIDAGRKGAPGTVERFRARTGVEVRYTEAINDNNEYFAKIQPRLGTGRVIEADLVVLTSWMADRLIRLGWADALPLDQVPNQANLDDRFRRPDWDPTGEYCLPWQGVMIGVGYNREATGRDLGSMADLFAPDLRGRVGLLTEMRDTVGMLLLGLGIDPSTLSSFDQAAPAFAQLEQAKAAGQVRAFTGNDFVDDLSTGNFAACLAWASDVLQLARDNPAVRFLIPEEGGLLAMDTMLMPRGARNRTAAARWMDFVYEPAQAARITAAVQAVSPVKGAKEELAKLDPELADHPLLFPDAATAARLKEFAVLDEDVEAQYDEAFARITGA
jgi:spermidine/putrescine transport system substrate-binding protein